MADNNNSGNKGYINQGVHNGDVNQVMQRFNPPDPYDPKAILCQQCLEKTWRDNDQCHYCGNNIRRQLKKTRLEFEIRAVDHRKGKFQIGAFIGIGLIVLGILPFIAKIEITIIGFVLCLIMLQFVQAGNKLINELDDEIRNL